MSNNRMLNKTKSHDHKELMRTYQLCREPSQQQMARDLLFLYGKVTDDTNLDYCLATLTKTHHDMLGLKPCALCAFAMCRSPDGKTACGMEQGCIAIGRLCFFIRNTPKAKREIRKIISKAYHAIVFPKSPSNKKPKNNGTNDKPTNPDLYT